MTIYALVSYFITILTMKSIIARRYIIGSPTVIIQNGKILFKNLKKAKMDVSDLLEQARANGYFDLSEIEFTSSVHKVIAEYVIEKERANDRVRPSELFEFLDENCPEFNEILDLNYEDKLAGEVGEKFFIDSVRTLEKQDLERKIERLQKACGEETDVEKRKKMMKDCGVINIEKVQDFCKMIEELNSETE